MNHSDDTNWRKALIYLMAATLIVFGILVFGRDVAAQRPKEQVDRCAVAVISTAKTAADRDALLADAVCFNDRAASYAASAKSRLQKVDELNRALAATPAPEPDPAPQPDPSPPGNPTPPKEPEPQPDPDPVPDDPAPGTPPNGIAIDGVGVVPLAFDTIVTWSGTWRVYSAADAHVWRLDENPAFVAVCFMRAADPGVWTEQLRTASIAGVAFTVRVAPGSYKCAENMRPVEPSSARIVQAVRDGLLPAYGLAAFDGWPRKPAWGFEHKSFGAGKYDPARLYGRSSSNNAIGVVSGQGGAYSSSRGFIDGDSAQMVAAALASDEARFMQQAAKAESDTLYGLGLPNMVHMAGGALGEPADHESREGQWQAPADYPYLAELGATAGTSYQHRRDAAHLFNHGFAWWLATGDPRAALLQQAILQYALGAAPNGQFAYGRFTINVNWTAPFKAAAATPASARLLWSKARVEGETDRLYDFWVKKWREMAASSAVQDRGTTAAHWVDRNVGDASVSNFMMLSYGIDAAYVMARRGRLEPLKLMARHLILRFGVIGGSCGFYGRGAGSGFRIIESTSTVGYDGTTEGLAAWSIAGCAKPRDSFDGSPVHYVQRAWWGLKMAAQLVPGETVMGMNASAALARMQAARAATTAWRDASQLTWAYSGMVFQ